MAGTYTRHQFEDINERLGKYTIDKWARLRRFLILGTDGGTYYASEKDHTFDNIEVVKECIAEDHVRTILEAVKVSRDGLAKSNEPAIYVMAMTSMYQSSLDFMPQVCRTSTHLFTYMEMIKRLKPRGFGNSLRRAIGNWYASKDDEQVAYQLIKYRQRNGWTHRDVMMHGRPSHREVYKYVKPDAQIDLMKISPKAGNMLRYADQAIHATSVEQVIEAIQIANIPWECVPTNMLNDPFIWHELFAANAVPYMATVRNFNRFLKMGDSLLIDKARNIIGNPLLIRKSKVHPIQLLNAWKANQDQAAAGAFEDAFEHAYVNVEPTGKRILIAIDVSGSMDYGMNATSRYDWDRKGLTNREAAVATATVMHEVEPSNIDIVAFSRGLVPLRFYPKLSTNIKTTAQLSFSATDCTLPMAFAAQNNLRYDAFVIITDNETNHNRFPPAEVLREYRKKFGVADCKLVVMACTATKFSIADPNDMNMLDVAGFSSDAPAVVAQFIKGWG